MTQRIYQPLIEHLRAHAKIEADKTRLLLAEYIMIKRGKLGNGSTYKESTQPFPALTKNKSR